MLPRAQTQVELQPAEVEIIGSNEFGADRPALRRARNAFEAEVSADKVLQERADSARQSLSPSSSGWASPEVAFVDKPPEPQRG